MNNTFNIQRFGLLLKRQWLEFGKIYLITLAVTLGVIATFYTFTMYEVTTGDTTQTSLAFREPLFLIFGFMFISIIASSYFSHLGQKPKAIIDLLIPASTFEKFLAGVFFTSIIATVSFLSLFYLTDLAFVMKINFIDNANKTEVLAANNLDYFFIENSPNFFRPFYVVPFFITSVFLLGSIYFNKFHYIKTAISVLVFSGILGVIIYNTGEFLFEGKVRIEQEGMNMNHMTKNTAEWLGMLLLLVLTAIFWSITYVRLKEKEV